MKKEAMLAEADNNVVVVQRQTLDWANMDAMRFRELSRSFCHLWGKPDDLVYRMMQLWDQTFSIGYFETRHHVKMIAEKNIDALEEVIYVPYDEYKNIPNVKGIYLFVDDDDWLSPRLSDVLNSFDPGAYDGILWRIATLGSPKQKEALFIWGLNGRCMTNNYAVSSVWLDGLRNFSGVAQHALAARVFAGLTLKTQLNQVLSVTNKNPCSSVSLENGLEGDFRPARLLELVESYVRKMNKISPSKLSEIRWSVTYMEDTIQLFEKVLASHK